MENKKKYIFITVIIIILVIGVGTYAWLSYRTNDTAMVLTIGDIDNVQITLKPYQIDTEILPVLTYEGEDYIEVEAVNNSNIGMNFKLYYQINNIDSELATTSFKYTITKSTNGNTFTEYKTGNFNGKSNGSILNILEEEMVPKNTTYKYRVYIWLDGSSSGQSSIQGKNFNGELRAEILGLAKAYLVDLTGTNNYYKEDTYREKITSVSFVGYIDTTNAVKIYDLGMDTSKPVTGWLEDNGNDTYNLYIGSEYKIYGTSFYQSFFKMTNLQTITFDNLDTSEATDMTGMFLYCSSLTMLDLSSFDTSNVTTMLAMFSGCSSLTSLNLSNFVTLKVTDISYMFYGCSNLTSLNLSSFDTSNVTTMYAMFYNCSSLTSLNLSNFVTLKVTDMPFMFSGCSSLTTLDLSNFNTSNVTDMQYMFSGCNNLINLNLNNFDTSNVINMDSMFRGCGSLTILDLNIFNTSNVTDMQYMFADCNSLTSLNLNNFNTSKVANMTGMFYGSNKLATIYVSNLWNTLNVTSSVGMFYNCTKLPNFNSSVIDKTRAHYNTGGYLTYKANS